MTFFIKREQPFFLSIKNNCLRVMAVNFTKEITKIISFGEIGLNTGLVKDGVIIQESLAAQSIDNILKKSQPQKITSHYCLISLSDQDVFSKSLTIPKIKPAEFDTTIRYQIMNFLPHKIEDMHIDWHILAETDQSFVVHAVAVHKNIIDSYLNTCKLINILPLGFEPESASLARLAALSIPNLSLIINCDQQTATFSFVEKGGALFVFSAKYFDVNNNERELLAGVDLAYQYYRNTLLPEKAIKGIYLVGTIDKQLVLTQKIQELFQITAAKLALPVVFPGQLTNDQQKSLMPLIGLSLFNNQLNKGEKAITLLPQEVQKERDHNKFIDQIRIILHLDGLIFAVAIAFLLAIYLTLILQNEFVTSSLSGFEKIIITPRQQQLEKEVLGFNLRLSALTKLLPRKKASSPIFEQFIREVPAGIKVKEFSYDNNKKNLIVRGTANKREDILVFEKSLSTLGTVSVPLTSFEENTNAVFSAVIALK